MDAWMMRAPSVLHQEKTPARHACTDARTHGRTDVLEEAREEFAALHIVGRLPLLEERQELAQVLAVLVSVEVVVVWFGGERGGFGWW